MIDRIFSIFLQLFLAGLIILSATYYLTPCSQIPQSIQVLRTLNNKTADTLHELVQTKFFRIIRLNLNAKCPIPYMNKLCKSKSCSVCRCDQKDIPQNWITTDKVKSTETGKDVWAKERDPTSDKWVWHVQDEQNDQGEYFDVSTNVQSFSGYNGSYIWSLIYEQNCFQGANNYEKMCLEEQVLYKIISGLHTSISSHLSRLFKNVTRAAVWADKGDQSFFFNHHQYNERVVKHPDRINNLLFLYQILVRSVQKLIPYLQQNSIISSDNIAQDFKSTQLLDELIKQIKLIKFKPLNETDAYFFIENNPHVKQYQRYIHNISDILNCVDCQKCRLFGKMQTYGLGTALKILLGYNTQYKRNELVAMFNSLNKVSISVNTYFNYQKLLTEGWGGDKYSSINYMSIHQKHKQNKKDPLLLIKIWIGCGGTLLAFIWVISKMNVQKKVQKQFKHAFPPKRQ